MCVCCIVTSHLLSLQVEWSLPDRRVDVPEALKLRTASVNLVKYTSIQPGRILKFEPDAKDLLDCHIMSAHMVACSCPLTHIACVYTNHSHR